MRVGYEVGKRYRIIRSLGEGGMANVYEAEDLVQKRRVTLKMLRFDLQDDPRSVERFHKEANSLTKLDNPHIVQIYDFGNDHGVPYLIMEYVKGTDLKTYLKEHYPLSCEKVVDIMEQILSAVESAHRIGIIHRDLKPQNILIDNYGKVKVTDFGISIAAMESATITKTNTMIGSVHYISPEQARGSIITKQSDIYSLGIILFELLTGKVPFEGQTAVSIAVKHYRDNLPSARKINPKVPQALENVILHATAKKLKDRYPDAETMARDLKTALLPVRKNEPKWEVPTEDDAETKTLVIPTTESSKRQPSTGSRKTKKTKQQKKKRVYRRHPIAFLIGTLGVIVVITILLMSLKVQVPDLRGMSVREAQEVLLSNNLKLGKKRYEYSSSYLKGQTISSDPARETTVSRNSKVNIVISKGPLKTKFGSYIGQNFDQVRKKLKAKGVLVDKETTYSNKYPAGQIVSQSIDPSMKVSLYQLPVTFTVSEGVQTFKIRDLTGYTQKSVIDYAQEHNITIIFEQQYSNTVPKGQVISQNPKANTTVKAGSQVIVTLSLGQNNNSENGNNNSATSQS
ncbi:Stk1 family PASTA domain-containing Ser/Thr kinase [Ligilactobacillus aviarius]|uniref:non-specific serine/threonine protein kinase n=1 Tax=Ligilactobacillus aviarius TaxID=1606 RepID=A0A510WTF2_9LACO|nr:Stk1 family PASTA domain-containing Ser/Thr kinase [Ligilactobacillus aviarius]KRM38271.1 non-specific serine threonine protein kinase [Ligilactobacillus aviarius subsp. aviarius DSM 20655]GEK41265.1 protein kinase [Ligilactobacillus aviarius]